jgi:aminoglycoside phosphotransferase (APT) family kinase protein
MADASKTRPMRPGEELDLAAVDRWLRTVLTDLPEGIPEVWQYAGGASNWTYRLKYGERYLVLRRPPAGTKAKSAHDMAREVRIQSALKPAFPVVPTVIGLCQDPSVIGCDFYVMEHLDGGIPRANLPPGFPPDPDSVRTLCTNLIDKLIELHSVDPKAVGLDALSRGTGYAKRQVDGWSDRYERARTWNVPSFRKVRAWLKANTPEDVKSCVIHGDWRFDNVVLDRKDPTKIIGVLDWELATIGDPLMDLGSALAYWVQADDNRLMRSTRRQPTHLPGMMTRAEVVAYYLERTGLSAPNWAFYEVFGLFRLAGIIQQIYFRYHHKQTRNPAFKNFWILVNYFDWRCRGIIRRAESTGSTR